MFTNICYYFIRYYTYIAHYFNKLYSFFKKNPTKLIKNKFEIIKNNISKEICLNEIYQLPFDFILYNNTHIYFKIQDIDIHFNQSCSYKFLSMNIIVNELNFNIDLKGYYIIGNKINNYIIYYLLKLQHNIDANKNTYILTIIDHNIKIFNINETQTILFHLNDYSIV